MAGTLYVVNQNGERLVLDPSSWSLSAVSAVGDGYSTMVVTPKPRPSPSLDHVETKGTSPPKPVDLDMSFIGGLPDNLDAHRLWPGGTAAPNIATIKGSVSVDHLKVWARGIPEGEHQVLILGRADGG